MLRRARRHRHRLPLWLGLLAGLGTVAPALAEDGPEIVTPMGTPPPNLWDRLAFFPPLRDLDDGFRVLMLRAAYEGDVAWGQSEIEEERLPVVSSLRGQVESLLVERDEAERERERCRVRARAAMWTLRDAAKHTEDEYYAGLDRLLDLLTTRVEEERAVWEGPVLVRRLTPAAREAWADFIFALENSRWLDAQARYADLEGHRMGIDTRVLDDAEKATLKSTATAEQLTGLLEYLKPETAYDAEQITSKRQKKAMEHLVARDDCEARFFQLDDRLRSRQRKLDWAEAGLGAGADDPLRLDAWHIAERYRDALAKLQLVDAYLSNEQWVGIWWRAGVARRLAGDRSLGTRLLAQAAAVADDNRLPVDDVPPSIEPWLRSAENEVLRQGKGTVRVVLPPEARLTVDGLTLSQEEGKAVVELSAGIHRFVVWVGDSEPIMRLLGVYEDEERTLRWWERPALSGDEDEIMGARPILPTLFEDPAPKRWHIGVVGRGGLNLGRGVGGAQFVVRYLPTVAGLEIGAAVMSPDSPYWLRPRKDLVAYAHTHAALLFRARWSRVDLVAGAGAYFDPLLGFGPLVRAEVGYDTTGDERLRIGLDVTGAWDVALHDSGIPRLKLTAGLGLWF